MTTIAKLKVLMKDLIQEDWIPIKEFSFCWYMSTKNGC